MANETVNATLLNYDRIGWKPEPDGATHEARRMTSYGDRGDEVTMPSSEFDRLRKFDPPAVAETGSDEAQQSGSPTPATPASPTTPAGTELNEPSTTRTAGTPLDPEIAADATRRVLASLGIEADDARIADALVDAGIAQAPPPAAGTDENLAALTALSTPALRDLAVSNNVDVGAKDSKKVLAAKLNDAGVTPASDAGS